MCIARLSCCSLSKQNQRLGGMSIEELENKLQRLAHNVTKRHPSVSVEDLVQVGFEVAVRMQPGWDSERGGFFSYIFKTVHGGMIDLCRRVQVELAASVADVAELEPVDDTPDSLEQLLVLDEQFRTLDRVMSALDSMPSAVRELVIGRTMHGQTLREVASSQGLGYEVVAKRYTRALRRLCKIAQKERGESQHVPRRAITRRASGLRSTHC